ncbi:MAG TPA: glycosyltransferase family 2 protein [Solirubrobacteraceae bacterium]|nr:glycosyltransferase family 2 protein [Solirubrobacteraceae bacterium]
MNHLDSAIGDTPTIVDPHTDEPPPTFSFVLPVFNEEDGLHELHRRLSSVVEEVEGRCEIIMVDDGSRDASYDVMRSIQSSDERVKLIRLSRNFGHQVAITAGLDMARGDAVIVMDADLQHPPEIVPLMVSRWREGFDIVNAVPVNRSGDTRFKRVSARLFYKLLSNLSDVTVVPHAGDFRLVDRGALEAIMAMRENTRYLRGMFSWVGFNHANVPYDYQPRATGKSKYTLRRMVSLGVDGIAGFSYAPLQGVLHLGFFVAAISFLAGIGDVASALAEGNVVPGWLSLIIMVSFLGGVQLVVLGVMGTYMARMFEEMKNRPLYIVRELVGVSMPPAARPRSVVINHTNRVR